ncbi:hypothetical protein E2C01_003852 [Portunus trituberculatus]|uniref:Uncharacterized protein n=1 Tax=Portunus trituberculatus TaxID=210409 RepID=A0A5B7CN74_PORTR|nr:hypothetical protein [Portunus trituberculatus]
MFFSPTAQQDTQHTHPVVLTCFCPRSTVRRGWSIGGSADFRRPQLARHQSHVASPPPVARGGPGRWDRMMAQCWHSLSGACHSCLAKETNERLHFCTSPESLVFEELQIHLMSWTRLLTTVASPPSPGESWGEVVLLAVSVASLGVPGASPSPRTSPTCPANFSGEGSGEITNDLALSPSLSFCCSSSGSVVIVSSLSSRVVLGLAGGLGAAMASSPDSKLSLAPLTSTLAPSPGDPEGVLPSLATSRSPPAPCPPGRASPPPLARRPASAACWQDRARRCSCACTRRHAGLLPHMYTLWLRTIKPEDILCTEVSVQYQYNNEIYEAHILEVSCSEVRGGAGYNDLIFRTDSDILTSPHKANTQRWHPRAGASLVSSLARHSNTAEATVATHVPSSLTHSEWNCPQATDTMPFPSRADTRVGRGHLPVPPTPTWPYLLLPQPYTCRPHTSLTSDTLQSVN